MPKEFIVAIELGSSKITGIAGKKNLDGSITVLAVVTENSTSCIRKGVVYNIDKTVQCLTTIMKRLESILKTKIVHVYVGVGGQSIRSIKNVIVKDKSKVLPEFLALVMRTKGPEMEQLASGATFKEISKANMGSISIDVPSIEVQTEILNGIHKEQSLVLPSKDIIKVFTTKMNARIKEIWGE